MKVGMMRWAALLLAGLATTPVLGATVLQCVPYARTVSGVRIYGDALTWWDQAENHYKRGHAPRSEEHTSELQSLMRISYAVFCLKKKKSEPQNINNQSR